MASKLRDVADFEPPSLPQPVPCEKNASTCRDNVLRAFIDYSRLCVATETITKQDGPAAYHQIWRNFRNNVVTAPLCSSAFLIPCTMLWMPVIKIIPAGMLRKTYMAASLCVGLYVARCLYIWHVSPWSGSQKEYLVEQLLALEQPVPPFRPLQGLHAAATGHTCGLGVEPVPPPVSFHQLAAGSLLTKEASTAVP